MKEIEEEAEEVYCILYSEAEDFTQEEHEARKRMKKGRGGRGVKEEKKEEKEGE